MGYITTFSVYNDNLAEIEKNPKDFTKEIVKSACSVTRSNNIRIGTACNAIITQKTRHSSDATLFMQAGNTVVDVYDITNDWARDQFIKEMTYHLKRLKQLKKEENGSKE